MVYIKWGDDLMVWTAQPHQKSREVPFPGRYHLLLSETVSLPRNRASFKYLKGERRFWHNVSTSVSLEEYKSKYNIALT